MKKLLVKYYTQIVSISFLIYMNIIFYIFKHNAIFEGKEYIYAILVILELLFVFFIIGEMIYFIVKTSKNHELKGNTMYYILIYIFNIFYIPCFNTKYIQKDKNYKRKNIIFLVLSILLYMLLNFNVMTFKPLEEEKTYTSIDDNVTVTLSQEYSQEIVGEYDLYFSKGNINVGLFLYDDENAESVLNYQSSYIARTRDNSILVSKDKRKINGKEINTVVYNGKMDDVENTYMMSTITSSNNKNYVVYVVEITRSEEYQSNKNEMEDILEKITIKKKEEK